MLAELPRFGQASQIVVERTVMLGDEIARQRPPFSFKSGDQSSRIREAAFGPTMIEVVPLENLALVPEDREVGIVPAVEVGIEAAAPPRLGYPSAELPGNCPGSDLLREHLQATLEQCQKPRARLSRNVSG